MDACNKRGHDEIQEQSLNRSAVALSPALSDDVRLGRRWRDGQRGLIVSHPIRMNKIG